MTQSWNNTRFKKSCLASLIAVLLSPSVYALESLSDDHLSNTTGEGVALALENFKMVFRPLKISLLAQVMHVVLLIQGRRILVLFVLFRLENYARLGERAYHKTYDLAYTNAYLGAQASTGYATIYTYDSIYNPKYTELETKYTKDIKATEKEAKQPQLRSDLLMPIIIPLI